MKPIFQTIIDPLQGNCLQAAVASLMDLPLEAVPHFTAGFGAWRVEMREFLHGHKLNWLNLPFYDDALAQTFARNNPQLCCFCLLEVASFHFAETKHCVVGLIAEGKLSVVHDPNPKNQLHEIGGYRIFEVDLFFSIAAISCNEETEN